MRMLSLRMAPPIPPIKAASAVRAQKDMSVAGIVKRKPDYVAREASRNYRIFSSDKESLKAFSQSSIEAEGTMEELLDDVDIVVDATPEGQGEKNIQVYKTARKKAIFQVRTVV